MATMTGTTGRKVRAAAAVSVVSGRHYLPHKGWTFEVVGTGAGYVELRDPWGGAWVCDPADVREMEDDGR